MKANADPKNAPEEASAGSWLELVRRYVSSLKSGFVQIVVHDARVVQIECTKKIRLEYPIAPSNRADY